ncbi:MAG: tRNA pseudouridine(38-40) synthase TruA [Rikenellaceae bacterium]
MKRYFIELAYNGQTFNGWQRQPNAPSVQQTIEEALSKLLREEISIVGCGRTDTGVHASFYIAHFESEKVFAPGDDFIYHLNCILPREIAIYKIYETTKHARFDARMREYKYFIERRKTPFNIDGAWQLSRELNVDAMQTAARSLMLHSDFTSFAKLHSDNKSNICAVTQALWREEGSQLIFIIRSDRFVRGMVRGIVGTLVDVGLGKMSAKEFDNLIKAENRALASAQAPAQGLYLSDIHY